MEKESNIYYHKYLKYKNKYLQAKNFLGGAGTPNRLPNNYYPPYGQTAEKTVYDEFYKSFTSEVLECIRDNAHSSPGLGGREYKIIIDTSSPLSGIYFKFEFDDSNKISVHIDKGSTSKIHIYQKNYDIYGNSMIINFPLAIKYEGGNLRLISRGNKGNKIDHSWLEIRQEFKDLLTIIERCINDANTSKIVYKKLEFHNEVEEGTGVACENPKAAGAGP